MTCPSCKQPNAPERNYCGACGTLLALSCARCGFRNLASDRFCGGCGVALGAAPRAEATGPGREIAAGPDAIGASAENSGLAELLAAAREPVPTRPEDLTARVSQDDIDSLFGD